MKRFLKVATDFHALLGASIPQASGNWSTSQAVQRLDRKRRDHSRMRARESSRRDFPAHRWASSWFRIPPRSISAVVRAPKGLGPSEIKRTAYPEFSSMSRCVWVRPAGIFAKRSPCVCSPKPRTAWIGSQDWVDFESENRRPTRSASSVARQYISVPRLTNGHPVRNAKRGLRVRSPGYLLITATIFTNIDANERSSEVAKK